MKSNKRVVYELKEDLSEVDLARLSAAHTVALDCEMTGLNPNRDLLCLVQLSDGADPTLILKTQDWSKADNLRALLVDPAVTKIFHFAIMDCGFLLKYLGVMPVNAYCTKIASKLARTYSPEHGLSALVSELLEIDMDKTQQTTFWGGDSLSERQLQYAGRDVAYLIEIRERLESILKKKGTLPTGITYKELNLKCQAFIPYLTHLWVNGWDFGREDRSSVFGH
jgi:ribonuclease D